MKVARIVLHGIFFILGLSLISKFPVIIENEVLLFNILSVYALVTLLFSVTKAIFLLAFPRYLGIFLAFGFLFYKQISNGSGVFTINQLQNYLTYFSAIIALAFFINSIIGTNVGFHFRKIATKSFRNYYWPNYLVFFLVATTISLFVFAIEKMDDHQSWQYALAFLLALFPHFNKNLVRKLSSSIKSISDKLDLDITFNQIGLLPKIRNFVFLKDKLIESGDYKLIDSDYRSTIRVITAMQISLQLSNEWNRKYAKLFVNDDFEKIDFEYEVVTQDKNGITVVDDGATLYHFGNYSYVKDKVKRDNKANLFLLKNDIPIAKYVVNEKVTDEKAELVNQLDYFGNTILFYSGAREDLGRDYEVVFDKVYSGLTEKKQNALLNELNKRAATAFITSKNPKNIENPLSFYVTSKTDVAKSEKLVHCTSKSLPNIPILIKYAKKVHKFLKYALFSSLIIQLSLLVFAIISYQNPILILALNLGLATFSEFFVKIFSKKLGYLPDQPAMRAQSHQAA